MANRKHRIINRINDNMVEKKLVDNIGSVDDFGLTGGYDPAVLRKEPKKERPLDEGVIVVKKRWEKSGYAQMGNYDSESVEPLSFVVESRETSKGVKKTVFPLLPFCRWCSPAAQRDDDAEWTSGWSEDGAEVRMSKRDARLVGVAPADYYSFSLIERKGNIICMACEQSPLDGVEKEVPVKIITKPVEVMPANYDIESPQFGIKVEKEIIRIPEQLVAKWVAHGQLKTGEIAIGNNTHIYSIQSTHLLEAAVWDITNKEWVLSFSKCKKTKILEAELINDVLSIKKETLIGWRKSALSVQSIVGGNSNGLTYTTTLQEFLVGGYEQGSQWVVDTDNCSGPYFMDLSWINEDYTKGSTEVKKSDDYNQTDIFDF